MCAAAAVLNSNHRNQNGRLRYITNSNIPPDKTTLKNEFPLLLPGWKEQTKEVTKMCPSKRKACLSEDPLSRQASGFECSTLTEPVRDTLTERPSSSPENSPQSQRVSESFSKHQSPQSADVSRNPTKLKEKNTKQKSCLNSNTKRNKRNKRISTDSSDGPVQSPADDRHLSQEKATDTKKGQNKTIQQTGKSLNPTGQESFNTGTSTTETSAQVPNDSTTRHNQDRGKSSVDNENEDKADSRNKDVIKKPCMDPETERKCKKLKDNIGIVLDKPRNTRFAILETRINSFKNWPKSSGQDPRVLAEAGFYLTRDGKTSVCYHCNCKISGWKSGQDPFVEHVKLFSYCAHVRQVKGDRYILALLGDEDDVSDTDESVTNIEIAIERNKDAIEAARAIFDLTDQQIREAVGRLTEKDARRVFDGTTLVKTVEELKQEKKDGKANKDVVNGNQNDNSVRQKSVQRSKQNEEESFNIDELKNVNEQLKDSFACKVCFDNMAGIITIPCGHLATCSQCVAALDKCPLCRTEVKGTVKAMFAT